jgi:hypothetical protein
MHNDARLGIPHFDADEKVTKVDLLSNYAKA